jgi:phytoene dehydrogenase-like protein
MKAHIVGGGFGGLAAAAYLIRHAAASGRDIKIYESDDKLGGGFFLRGSSAASGHNLPGSVFDKKFRCAFDLLAAIPTASAPKRSVKDQFFTYNNDDPFAPAPRARFRAGVVFSATNHQRKGSFARSRFCVESFDPITSLCEMPAAFRRRTAWLSRRVLEGGTDAGL